MQFLLRMLPFLLLGAGIASEGLGIPPWLKVPLIVAGSTLLLYYLWRMRRDLAEHEQKEKEPPIQAIVMLLARMPHIGDEQMIQAVEEAMGFKVNRDRGKDARGNLCIVGVPVTMITAPQGFFLVHRFDRPYFDGGSAAAMGIQERRQQIAIDKHRAWMSVDCITAEQGQTEEQIIALLARLAGRLAPDDYLAIYRPDTRQLIPFEAAMKQALREGSWSRAAGDAHVPIINIPDDDPRMQAAEAEARERYPEFVAAFDSRRSDQMFSVKARFEEGEAVEYMWINVEAIENDVLYGRLDNAPADLKKLKENDRVRVEAGQVNDWLYTDKKELKGGFTVKVIQEAMNTSDGDAG